MSLAGAQELSVKLAALGKVGKKVLRSAALKATNKTVLKMRQKAPKGPVGEAHRTYKGRLVPSGFLKKSIRRRSFFEDGKAKVLIGVRKEAFYGIAFLDEGVASITSRRPKKGQRTNTFKLDKNGRGRIFRRRSVRIKPYSLPAYDWFKSTFIADQSNIERSLVEQLRIAIRKATNG